MMDIRQISIRYHQDHDRIKVNINTSAGEEVQMWLTRRMTLRLWPLINQVVIDHFAVPEDAKTDGFVNLSTMDPQTKAILADFQRQEAIQNADFSTPYQAAAAMRPMGESPLVVTEVNLTPQGNGQMQLNFRELLDEPVSSRGFQMDLPIDLVFALMQLLSHALEQAQWQTDRAIGASPIVIGDVTDEIDLTPDAPRPTYLN